MNMDEMTVDQMIENPCSAEVLASPLAIFGSGALQFESARTC